MGRKISKAEKERREAERLEKAKKREYYKFMGMFLLAMAAVWLVGYFYAGIEFTGAPVKQQVVSVEVTNTKFSEETKVYTDKDEIKQACSVFKIVRIQHSVPEGTHEPHMTMVFNMKNGSQKVLQLSDEVAIYNGVTKKFMRSERVLEILDSVFFPEYVTTEDGASE